VLLYVELKVEEQYQELAVRGSEAEVVGGVVKVNHRRAVRLNSDHCRIKCRGDLRGSVVDALPRSTDDRTLQPVRIEEGCIVGRKRGTRAADGILGEKGVLPAERYAVCGWIVRVSCATDDDVQGRGRIRHRACVWSYGVLRVRNWNNACATG